MSPKAISPMIATILLIAFTVAVGGIISVWLTGYTRTTGAAVSGATEDQIKCSGTYPYVYYVTDKAVFIMNPGSENISGIVCMAGNGTSLGGVDIDPLVPGNITSKTWTRGNNNAVVCSGRCRSIGVSGECRTGQTCWAS
ncbi:MAG: archaellin/type IV pilin N-terminal domain-containing protein [Candidatus Aenigmatarchaeota archaeon]